MVTSFKQWADGCETHLNNMAREIEALGNVTRDVRTNAGRFDQTNMVQMRAPDNYAIEQTLAELLEMIENLSSSAAWRNFDAAVSARMLSTDAMEGPPKALQTIASSINVLLADPKALPSNQPTEQNPRPRRRPTLLQAGARHFAALAGVFQLQDCFDQRVEHINAASNATSQSPQDDQTVMMQIVNAQVAGIASMAKDFTDAVVESGSVLQSLHETTISQALERDPLTQEDAQSLLDLVITPISDFISMTRSMHLELDSVTITGETGQTAAANEAQKNLSNDQKDEVSAALKEIEDRLELLVSKHPRIASALSSAPSSLVLECYDTLQASLLNLGDLAHQLDAFTADLAEHESSATQPGPQACELIEQIVASFTMDVEREDHRSALHRMGLATH